MPAQVIRPCQEEVSLKEDIPFVAQINVLNYLQTICCDVSMANVIVSAPVTELLVRMLASARHPALQIRLACVLGLLVRYCTFIDDDVYATGVTFPFRIQNSMFTC